MLGNAFLTVLAAAVIGYVLGSFPSAYLITRLVTKKDIRRLGGGNVGGLNTLKEVGIFPAIIVVMLDIGKGVAAILVTYYTLQLDQPYVLVAAGSVVAGHNWMPWLRFTGGKGMAAAVGTLVAIFLVFQQPSALLFFFGILALVFIPTRNVALSSGISLLALPFVCWLWLGDGQLVIWSLLTGIIIAAKFAPTALAALAKNPNWKDYIRGS